METFRTSFAIKAAYNVLPFHKNLIQWYREDPVCSLCPIPATLKHILKADTSGSTTSCYSVLQWCWKVSGRASVPSSHVTPLATVFAREGEGQTWFVMPRPNTGWLGGAHDWKIVADVGPCAIVRFIPAHLQAHCPGRIDWRRPTSIQ